MLKHRIIVAAILAPLFLWLIYLGGMPLAIICLILCAIMWHEFLNMACPEIKLSLRILTFLLGIIICSRALGLLPNAHANLFQACLLLLLFMAFLRDPLPIDTSINKLGVLFFGLFYCFSLLPFLSNLTFSKISLMSQQQYHIDLGKFATLRKVNMQYHLR